jgi:PTH1 family peptidyl-tRNA hydrolase
MHLVVGLGNPGRKYEATRHNLGYRVCDRLAEAFGASFDRDRFESLVAEAGVGGDKVLLVKPITFMNLSGRAVSAAAGFYKLPTERLLVVCDDFNLPLGQLRLRREGSHGGHNGLRDVIARLGTDAFPRLRMGIGPLAGRDPVPFCLAPFPPAEREAAEEMVQRAADAVRTALDSGLDEAMNRFNASRDAQQ